MRRRRLWHALRPKQPTQPSQSKQPRQPRPDALDDERRRAVLGSISVPIKDVVLIIANRPDAIANSVAEALPSATVHLLTLRPLNARQVKALRANVAYQPCWTIAERIAYLSKHAQPQAIVERGNNRRRQKVACFRELFPFVAAGGGYLVETLHERPEWDRTDVHPSVADLLMAISALHHGAEPIDASSTTIELAASAERVEIREDLAIVHKSVAHQFKVRDRDANTLLCARFGDTWGAVLDSKPAARHRGDVTVVTHGEGPSFADRQTMDVPERFLRRFDNVTCWPRQRVRRGDYWLPDTFRHALDRTLSHRRLINAGPHMARLGEGLDWPTRRVDGDCFFFDTEFPAHFGHVLTEVISRYWGWQRAKQLAPGVRPLLSLWGDADDVPAFQRAIFTALGVDLDTAEYIRPAERLHVETLYAATPDFVMPHYAAPELADVWELIRAGCEGTPPPVSAERIFVSREPKGIRTCLNTAEVEAMFTRLGFAVVHPQEHDFGSQVAMFSNAKVIAGFGGSGMFTSMFAPGRTVIVIAADGYTANNEYLIRAVVGGEIHYFWADSLIKQPERGWTWAAYQSNFTFDVARFEPHIAEVIEQVDQARPGRRPVRIVHCERA